MFFGINFKEKSFYDANVSSYFLSAQLFEELFFALALNEFSIFQKNMLSPTHTTLFHFAHSKHLFYSRKKDNLVRKYYSPSLGQ